jgi:hypothetical protein
VKVVLLEVGIHVIYMLNILASDASPSGSV